MQDFARLVQSSSGDWPEPTPPASQVGMTPIPALTASLAGRTTSPTSDGFIDVVDPVLGATLGTHGDRLALLSLLLQYEAERLQVRPRKPSPPLSTSHDRPVPV